MSNFISSSNSSSNNTNTNNNNTTTNNNDGNVTVNQSNDVLSNVTNDLKNAILNVLLDHTNESYNKLEELSSLQLECISELQAIKAQLGSNLGPNEVAELVSHSTLKLDEIELLMDSSAMRLRVINEGII